MNRTLASLFAIVIALPALAQDRDGLEDNQGAETPPPQDAGSGGLALRGDNGEEVEIDAAGTGDNPPTADNAGQPEEAAPDETGAAPPEETGDLPEEAVADDPDTDAPDAPDAPEENTAAADESDDEAATGTDSALSSDDDPDTSETGANTDDIAPPVDDALEDEALEDEALEDETLEDVTPDDAADETGPDSNEGDATVEDADAPAPAETVITPAAPFLSSTDYLEIRPDSTSEAIQLVWQVETFTPAGQRIGAAETRTLIMAPDFVRYERPGATEIFDFASNRHLELDIAAGTLTNIAFEGEVRRRLDTYLGLSQAGRLEQIPLGPDRSFDRFWLEAAMGIRREPVELDARLDGAELTVERGAGPALLTARFDIETNLPANEAAGEDPGEETDTAETGPEETDTAATDMSAADTIAAMAAPIDLSSGESVVFDPSQAAAPISLEDDSASLIWPDASPEQQAQAELFRRWMRHALPLHPDVLATLRGAPQIPEQFGYFIISPDSPEGRREIWTLSTSDTVAAGFRLEPGLAAQADSAEILGQVLAIAAMAAGNAAPDDSDVLEAIEAHRANGDPARAYLVHFHETSRNGPCPPPGQSARRAACAAASSVVASGLGNPSFETVFSAIEGIGGDDGESIFEALSPYLQDDGYSGAAARTIVANELLAWAARDADGPPADIDPFELLVESIAIDPHAGANYRYLGNALLNLRNPVGAWTVFDAGRAVPGAADNALLVQLSVLEERLRALAPDFFLPR